MDLELLRKIPKTQILIFDLEHTGEAEPEILQFSAVWATGREAFNRYVRPTHAKSWERTEAIHHITPEMVKDAETIRQLKPLFQSILRKAKVLVGFSTSDDFRVLKRNHIYVPGEKDCIHIDIAKPFNDLYADKVEKDKKYRCKSLKVCAAYYGYNGEDWHNSLSDAFATAMCFDRMLANGDLAYVSKKGKQSAMETPMKGSKGRRKRKQEQRRQRAKRLNPRCKEIA